MSYRDRYPRGRDRDRYDGGSGSGGAGHLARIHGTEEDRVNCPFYFKIGACRHGERCTRMHNKPVFSQTVIVPQFYLNPLAAQLAKTGRVSNVPKSYNDQPIENHFEDFYQEVFEECSKYGEIEELIVVENLGDHMVGNVYIKYHDEEDADKCQKSLNGRFYAGRQLHAEFSPVTDFREARCRQYHDSYCNRAGECNFIHTKRVSRDLMQDLFYDQRKRQDKDKRSSSSSSESSSDDEDKEKDGDKYKSKHRRSRSRSRSRSGGRRHKRSKSRSRSRSRSRSHRRARRYSRSRSRDRRR